MQSNRSSAMRTPMRRGHGFAGLLAFLMLAMLLAAPSALAWNGNLVVRKVNIGGPAGDSFNFAVAKTPNINPVWDPAEQTFSLTGASSAAGPFVEGVNQKTYENLWAGFDQGYDNWVAYTVREAAKAGYTTTVSCGIVGDWNAALGGSIPGELGQWSYTPGSVNGNATVGTTLRWYADTPYTTTCTFTNTYSQKPRVKVSKTFVGATGQNPAVDFSVNDADVDAVTPQASETFGDGYASGWIPVDGTSATIEETGTESTDLKDYSAKLECREGKDGEYGDWQIVTYSTAGTLEDLAAGYDYECRFTNTRKTGRITLKKLIVPANDQGTFELTADGPGPASTTDPLGNNGQQSFDDIPTGDYALSEKAADGTNAADYVLGSPVCVEQAQDGLRAGLTEIPVVDGKVQVIEGSDILCTWTNTRKGKIIIKKIAVNSAGAPVAGTFNFTGDLGAQQVIANGDGLSFTVVPDASYKIEETVPAGWTLTRVECVETVSGEGTESSTSGAIAMAHVQPGETVTCTWTNTQNSTPPGSESVGASGGVAPVGASGGVTQRRGTARISGTVGCASANYATVSVSGSRIKKVTYTVNGKKVKTLTKANSNGTYRLRYRTNGLKVGSYKVNARVEFVTASGTRTKNLKLQFSRCKPRTVKPTFTG